jgi:non-ribosomal peptide synthetase component F
VDGFSYARIWEGIAAVAPERLAVACGDTHLSFGALDARADRVAHVATRWPSSS